MALPNSPYTWTPASAIPSLSQFQAQRQPVGGYQAPKTDTTAGFSGGLSTPSSPYAADGSINKGWSIDYTSGGLPATSTGGGTTSWALPGWAYGGNQRGASNYNQQTGQWDPTGTVAAGSDVFGAKIPVGYDPRQDRAGLNLSGNNVETFWSRMLRFAKDAFDGAQRNGQPITAEQAMTQAVTRLRTDNGGTLQGTGFQDAAPTGVLTQPSHLPGSALPPTPPQTIQPDGSTAHGTPTVNPATPGGGGAPGSLAETQRQYLIDDPEYALRHMLQQRGIDVNQRGLVGAYMRSKYLDPLKATIAATGLGTGGSQVGDIEGVLAQFGAGLQGHGNELENFLHGIAQRAYDNPALKDLSDQDMMALDENLGALGTFGSNSYVASARKNQFDDLKQGFGDLFFGGLAGGEMPSFNDFMRNKGFRPY